MSLSKLVNVKAMFFDMDNTIINTREGDDRVCNKLNYFLNERYDVDHRIAEKITNTFLRYLRELRPFPDEDESLDEWRLSLWREALGPSYSHLADDVYKEWLRIRYRYVKASPEIISFLTELKSVYRLALITNGHKLPQWEKIRACDLEPHFDCIKVSGDTCWKKPDAKLFLSACEEMNVKPEQCIVIGDRVETDIIGGKNANFGATFWINYDSDYQTSPTAENHPDFIINHVLEMKQIIAQLTDSKWDNIS